MSPAQIALVACGWEKRAFDIEALKHYLTGDLTKSRALGGAAIGAGVGAVSNGIYGYMRGEKTPGGILRRILSGAAGGGAAGAGIGAAVGMGQGVHRDLQTLRGYASQVPHLQDTYRTEHKITREDIHKFLRDLRKEQGGGTPVDAAKNAEIIATVREIAAPDTQTTAAQPEAFAAREADDARLKAMTDAGEAEARKLFGTASAPPMPEPAPYVRPDNTDAVERMKRLGNAQDSRGLKENANRIWGSAQDDERQRKLQELISSRHY